MILTDEDVEQCFATLIDAVNDHFEMTDSDDQKDTLFTILEDILMEQDLFRVGQRTAMQLEVFRESVERRLVAIHRALLMLHY